MSDATIRCGEGSWTFKPWRGSFYAKGLRQADEFKYATSIEIDGTYYRTQTNGSYAKWSEQFSQWQDSGRDVYVYFINGAKVRAPAAAMALIEQLGE
jgi:uncharacterized protein YecE (DUF72 family)